MLIFTDCESLYVPDTIHPVLYYGGAIIMDTAIGRYEALNPPACDLLLAVNETGSREAVHDSYIAKFPEAPPEAVVDAVDNNLAAIIGRGVIAVGDSKPPRHFERINPDDQHHAGYENAVYMASPTDAKMNVSFSERALGLRSMVQMVKLLRQPFNMWASKLGRMKTDITEDASRDQVLHCKEVISSVVSTWPGRAACLETAVATVLFGHSRGLSIDLRFGVALDPIHFHTWLETPGDGHPVTLPNEEQVRGVYHPIYTI